MVDMQYITTYDERWYTLDTCRLSLGDTTAVIAQVHLFHLIPIAINEFGYPILSIDADWTASVIENCFFHVLGGIKMFTGSGGGALPGTNIVRFPYF